MRHRSAPWIWSGCRPEIRLRSWLLRLECRWRQAAAPAPAKKKRLPNGKLYEDVCAAVERCPERFDCGDVCRLLGYEPNRGNLYRVLQELIAEELFAVEARGEGTIPTKYRKL